MPDLLEEAKRLSEAIDRWGGDNQHHDAMLLKAGELIPELVERLEQAEQRIEVAQHHFRQIDEQHLSQEPPPQAFWDRLRAIRKALAAQQREDK